MWCAYMNVYMTLKDVAYINGTSRPHSDLKRHVVCLYECLRDIKGCCLLTLSAHVPEGYSSHLVCRSVNIGSQQSLGFKP